MGAHDGWVWQGRQYHQWFGHGTKPADAKDDTGSDTGLAQRLKTLALTALASLPRSQHGHRAARFECDAPSHLVQAGLAWARAGHMGETEFARHFFDSRPDSRGVQPIRDMASIAAHAETPLEMREASDALARAMQQVGLDRWPAFLREAAARAADAPAVASEAARPGDDVTRVYRIGSVRRSGGSADLVAGPGTRGTPTPEILDVERKLDEITERVKNAVNPTITKGMSPRVLGTMLHKMFKDAVQDAVKSGELPPSIRTEASFANGEDARYGEKGALRTDVVMVQDGKVIAIWDYKTGAGPTISERRVDALRRAVTKEQISPTVYFQVLHIPFYGRGS